MHIAMTRFSPFAFLLLAAAAPSPGSENPVLWGSVETISSPAWTVSGFTSTFELTAAGMTAEFRIGRIALTESGEVFDDIRVSCALIVLTTRSVDCRRATFTAALPGLERQAMPGAFSYDNTTKVATIELAAVAAAGGRLRGNITAGDAGIDARFRGSGLALSGLLELAGTFSDALSDYSGDGRVDLEGTLAAPADGPLNVSIDATLDAVSLANNAGTVATGDVAGKLHLELALDAGTNTIDLRFDSGQGEAYIEPLYANFSEHALRLLADDVVTTDFAVFDVGRFELQQQDLLDVHGAITLGFPADDDAGVSIDADVDIRDAAFSNLYENLLKVQFAGTVVGDLETDGRIAGPVRVAGNALQAATLTLEDVIVDDRQGRFALYGIDGTVDWRADDEQDVAPSRLHWDSGTAHDIVFGGGDLLLQLGDNDVELLAPLRLQTMGGALRINQLVLQDFGTDSATGRLDAELEPVQLGQLSGAFGWPAFSGTLSGRLPLLELANDTITVGGTLTASVFDGTMEISDLRIGQPFGRVPRLQADVRLRNLDLQRVTEAFSFGLIQGRLSGDITGLRMQNWRPVAMDMHFYTPADDRSQHRITQRAVENLASVGGNSAATVLSTGFMQFFDVFAYDRIGLRCVLSNGNCAMSGVGPAGDGPQGSGYYIVKGRGIPRIDVVGFRNTVNWSKLVQQLAAITRGGSPTVN